MSGDLLVGTGDPGILHPPPRPKPTTNSLLPFSEVGAAQQSLVFLELYPLTAGNRKEWESRLLVGNVCIYSGPVRVRERERRKKKKKTKRQLRGVPGSGAVTLNHLFSGHTDQQQPRTWAAEDQSFSLDNPKR